MVRRPDLDRPAGAGGGANGYVLKEGATISRIVRPFRSFVPETMRYGNLVLAGHARHTARPTGAKGLNLALADVRILSMHVQSHLQHGVVARTSTSIARCGGWGKHSTSRTG
ncbi:FAD-dependent monooxygenase [Streptomyces griseorubiginosus]